MKFWTALILLWGGMAAADYPLMVFRQTTTPVTKAAFFKASCGVHAQFRGAFDEFWFAGGKPLCKIDVCLAELKKFAALLNLSIGDTDEFTVRIRNPRGTKAVRVDPRGETPLTSNYDAARDELVVRIPNLGGWQIATVFL